jgi:hypothetical protein
MDTSSGVVLSTLGTIGTAYAISHANRVNELRALVSSILQQAESIHSGIGHQIAPR